MVNNIAKGGGGGGRNGLVVEHWTLNREVLDSIPTWGAALCP